MNHIKKMKYKTNISYKTKYKYLIKLKNLSDYVDLNVFPTFAARKILTKTKK